MAIACLKTLDDVGLIDAGRGYAKHSLPYESFGVHQDHHSIERGNRQYRSASATRVASAMSPLRRSISAAYCCKLAHTAPCTAPIVAKSGSSGSRSSMRTAPPAASRTFATAATPTPCAPGYTRVSVSVKGMHSLLQIAPAQLKAIMHASFTTTVKKSVYTSRAHRRCCLASTAF